MSAWNYFLRQLEQGNVRKDPPLKVGDMEWLYEWKNGTNSKLLLSELIARNMINVWFFMQDRDKQYEKHSEIMEVVNSWSLT